MLSLSSRCFCSSLTLNSLNDKWGSRILVPRFNICKTIFRTSLNIVQSSCFCRQTKSVASWKTGNRYPPTREPHSAAHLCSLHHQLSSHILLHWDWGHIYRIRGEILTCVCTQGAGVKSLKYQYFLYPVSLDLTTSTLKPPSNHKGDQCH